MAASFSRLLLLSLVAFAQEGASRKLPAANASLTEEFQMVSSVRELSDGRVLLTDQMERRLVVADFRSNSVKALSRIGQGPGEFERIRQLVPGGSDTTFMWDAPRSRGLVLVDTQVVQTPMRTPFLESQRLVTPGIAPGELFRKTVNTSWAHGETAAMCSDGWIGVVRMEPYRVDWFSPDSRWTRGASIPYGRIAVTEPEKQAYLKRDPLAATADPPNEWPTEIPPQVNTAPTCAPDGRLFIPRPLTVNRQYQLYDVVDRRGSLAMRLALDPNQRLVGFGPRSMYVVTKNDVDIERVGRYPYPF